VKPILDWMGEPEDAVPATIRSVIQGCGEFWNQSSRPFHLGVESAT
jgi:hypothetical protein